MSGCRNMENGGGTAMTKEAYHPYPTYIN